MSKAFPGLTAFSVCVNARLLSSIVFTTLLLCVGSSSLNMLCVTVKYLFSDHFVSLLTYGAS